MIVDTSALVSIYKEEAVGDRILEVVKHTSENIRMSAASYLETGIVLDALQDAVLSNRIDSLIDSLRFTIEPVTLSQAKIARQAYRDFGKGSGHAASLNFGDCFSYALAKEMGETILFVGNDFNKTDLAAVPY
jgi:ribonuclease VapC